MNLGKLPEHIELSRQTETGHLTGMLTPNNPTSLSFLDIELFLNRRLNDQERRDILTNTWIPDNTYVGLLPFSLRTGKNGTELRCYLRREHLQQYDWVVCSDALKGVLCKVCATSDHQEGGRGLQNLGVLVTKPLTNFNTIREKLREHNNAEYHKRNKEFAVNFLMTTGGSSAAEIDIRNRLSQERADEISKNRQIKKKL